MRILVTGGSGVVGRRAVPLLRTAGHDVTAVGRNLNLLDRDAVRRAVEGNDVVINLATHMPSSSLKMALPGAFRENDGIRKFGSANLVDAAVAAGVKRFIQESFAPVYPDRGDAWIDESTPLDPLRFNRTIVDAEANARRFPESVVLRFAAFYGPDSFVTIDMMKFTKKGFLPLPGAPGAFASCLSHDDAASAVVAALRLAPGVYNVVDDEPVTHRDFADTLADALGVPHPKLPPRWMTPLFGAPGRMLTRSLRISNQKLRGSGWRPRWRSVREGWKATISELATSRPTSRTTADPRPSGAPPDASAGKTAAASRRS